MPKTISELFQCIAENPDSQIWAGGTFIMSRPDFYPDTSTRPLIYLGKIDAFFDITKNIRTVDVGCMVCASRMLEIGKLIFNDLLLHTLDATASSIVRDQMTIGGALCTSGIRFALPGTLILMNTEAEILKVQDNKHTTKRIPLRRIYDATGKLQLEKNSIISKLRIEYESSDYERFICIGDPIRKPESTVILALRADITGGMVSEMQLCITFPLAGMYFASELCNELEGAQIPLSAQKVVDLSHKLIADIGKNLPLVTLLQRERCRRVFQNVLFSMKPKHGTAYY